MVRVLVCGGRHYADKRRMFTVLDEAVKRLGLSLLIHGAAKGADLLAEEWAKARQIPYIGVPAEWKRKGAAAGPESNGRMLADWRPACIIAFPGHVGTADMCAKADAAGVRVIEID